MFTVLRHSAAKTGYMARSRDLDGGVKVRATDRGRVGCKCIALSIIGVTKKSLLIY